MPKEKLICVKCKNLIDPNDQFSEIRDFANGKYLRTHFIHKICFFEGIKMAQGFGGIFEKLNKIISLPQ